MYKELNDICLVYSVRYILTVLVGINCMLGFASYNPLRNLPSKRNWPEWETNFLSVRNLFKDQLTESSQKFVLKSYRHILIPLRQHFLLIHAPLKNTKIFPTDHKLLFPICNTHLTSINYCKEIIRIISTLKNFYWKE